MKRTEPTQVDINNAVDVLTMLKARSEKKEALDAASLARSHKMKNYVHIGRAIAELKYAKKASGNRVEMVLETVEPKHGRALIDKMTALANAKARRNYENTGGIQAPINARKPEKVETIAEQELEQIDNKSKFVSKLTDEFKVVSAKEILLEKAIIELHGYRIEGTFTINKI